jgi:hypothetical protein
MNFLYVNNDVKGNEPHLKDALLTELLTRSEIWQLEELLSLEHDVNIELPADLRLIEKL